MATLNYQRVYETFQTNKVRTNPNSDDGDAHDQPSAVDTARWDHTSSIRAGFARKAIAPDNKYIFIFMICFEISINKKPSV